MSARKIWVEGLCRGRGTAITLHKEKRMTLRGDYIRVPEEVFRLKQTIKTSILDPETAFHIQQLLNQAK